MDRSLAHHKACCSGNAVSNKLQVVARWDSHSRRRASRPWPAGSQSRHDLVATVLLDTRLGSRRSGVCKAQDNRTGIGGYTPSDYITFSEDPAARCTHHVEAVVEAPIDTCFGMWNEWSRLVEFLDLIGQIGLDKDTPHMALFQCFYRFQQLPVMEICFLLAKVEVVDNRSIKFESVWGMPLMGEVTFSSAEDGRTRVALTFSHPLPTLLIQLSIGTFGVETDVGRVLRENMAEFQRIVEAAAPSDWPALKQQAAAEAAAAERAAAEATAAERAAAEAAAAEAARQAADAAAVAEEQAAQQQQLQQSQQQGATDTQAAASGSEQASPMQLEPTSAQAEASSAAGEAGVGRRRRTSPAATATAEAADAQAASAAPSRSRRTSSKSQAEEGSSTSSSRKGTSRRSTTASDSTAAESAPGKPRARTSRRSSTSKTEQPSNGQQPPVVNGVRSPAAQALSSGTGRRATSSLAQ